MIFVSEKAKARIEKILQDDGLSAEHFVRVSVTSGGCSGLSYKMEFDQEDKPGDEVFFDKGVKVVVDPKSILYLFLCYNYIILYKKKLNKYLLFKYSNKHIWKN